MNKKAALPIMLIVMIVLFILFALLAVATITSDAFTLPGGTKKHTVICDVQIHDSAVGQPKIDTHLCEVQGNCLLAMQPLSIFSNKGYVQLTMGGKTSKDAYKTFKVGGNDEVTLKLCTSATTGTLRLTDEQGKTGSANGLRRRDGSLVPRHRVGQRRAGLCLLWRRGALLVCRGRERGRDRGAAS